jgi:hypothetical protein
MVQKTKSKQGELEGPPAPHTRAPIQMTPSQLSARLAAAKTESDIASALESTLNYIHTLSGDMSDREYKENKALLQQIVSVRNKQAEEGLQPKLADKCIEELRELIKAPSAAKGTKTEIPMQFQQLGFFQLADIAGVGSVAFGNLPAQMAQQIPQGDWDRAHNELNKLANAYFSGETQRKQARTTSSSWKTFSRAMISRPMK